MVMKATVGMLGVGEGVQYSAVGVAQQPTQPAVHLYLSSVLPSSTLRPPLRLVRPLHQLLLRREGFENYVSLSLRQNDVQRYKKKTNLSTFLYEENCFHQFHIIPVNNYSYEIQYPMYSFMCFNQLTV